MTHWDMLNKDNSDLVAFFNIPLRHLLSSLAMFVPRDCSAAKSPLAVDRLAQLIQSNGLPCGRWRFKIPARNNTQGLNNGEESAAFVRTAANGYQTFSSSRIRTINRKAHLKTLVWGIKDSTHCSKRGGHGVQVRQPVTISVLGAPVKSNWLFFK